MDERERKEFVELCEHIMSKFKSIMSRVSGTSPVLDVIGLSDGERTLIEAFLTSMLKQVKNGDAVAALLSSFCVGVLFGQEGRSHIGDLQ